MSVAGARALRMEQLEERSLLSVLSSMPLGGEIMHAAASDLNIAASVEDSDSGQAEYAPLILQASVSCSGTSGGKGGDVTLKTGEAVDLTPDSSHSYTTISGGETLRGTYYVQELNAASDIVIDGVVKVFSQYRVNASFVGDEHSSLIVHAGAPVCSGEGGYGFHSVSVDFGAPTLQDAQQSNGGAFTFITSAWGAIDAEVKVDGGSCDSLEGLSRAGGAGGRIVVSADSLNSRDYGLYSARGGSGAEGIDGSDATEVMTAGNGSNGSPGGDGGRIECCVTRVDTLCCDFPKFLVQGGAGGDGGRGGDGALSSEYTADGGDGGYGGHGGAAGEVTIDTRESEGAATSGTKLRASIDARGGNGGDRGFAGDAGSYSNGGSGEPGSGGRGGDGGNGGIAQLAPVLYDSLLRSDGDELLLDGGEAGRSGSDNSTPDSSKSGTEGEAYRTHDSDFEFSQMPEWTFVYYSTFGPEKDAYEHISKLESFDFALYPSINFVVVCDLPGAPDPGNTRVAVLVGGKPLWVKLSGASWEYGEEPKGNADEWHTGNPANLFIMQVYASLTVPARHQALFVDGHGLGWLGTMKDEGSYLTADEIHAYAELSSSFPSYAVLPEPFDVVISNSCRTQTIEFAHAFSEFAAFVVASQSRVNMKGGVDPLKLLAEIASTKASGNDPFQSLTAETLAQTALQATTPLLEMHGDHYSMIDTRHIGDLTQSIKRFVELVERLSPVAQELFRIDYSLACESTYYTQGAQYYIADLGSFMNRLLAATGKWRSSELESAIKGVLDNLSLAVRDIKRHQVSLLERLKGGEVADTHGLSVYLPFECTIPTPPSGLERFVASNRVFCSATRWDDFLRLALDIAGPVSVTADSDNRTAGGAVALHPSDGMISIQQEMSPATPRYFLLSGSHGQMLSLAASPRASADEQLWSTGNAAIQLTLTSLDEAIAYQQLSCPFRMGEGEDGLMQLPGEGSCLLRLDPIGSDFPDDCLVDFRCLQGSADDMQPSALLSDARIDFGRVSFTESPTATLSVRNIGMEELLISSVSLRNSTPLIQWSYSPELGLDVTAGHGEVIGFDIHAIAPTNAGNADWTVTDTLVITTNDPKSPTIGVPVSITFTADVTPPTIEFVELGSIDFTSNLDVAPSTATRYRFSPVRDGVFTIVATAAAGDFEVSLYDANHSLLDTAAPVGDAARIDWTVAAGEVYAIGVVGNTSTTGLVLANLVNQVESSVTIYGTTGDDEFRFDPRNEFAISINGVGYRYSSHSARTFVFASSGEGVDVAYLIDSAGNDTLTLRPHSVELASPDFHVSAEGVYASHAYAIAGGEDAAHFHDSDENDKFKFEPAKNQEKMYRHGLFYNRAKKFEHIIAAMTNGMDSVRMFGSDGDEQFRGQRDKSRMTGPGCDVTVSGYDTLVAYASKGADVAYFEDSASDDIVRARPHKVVMWEGDYNAPEYKLTGRGFDEYRIERTQGGNDKLKLHDTAFDDYVEVENGTVEFFDTKNNEHDLLYKAIAYEWVKLYSGSGSDEDSLREDNSIDDFFFDPQRWKALP